LLCQQETAAQEILVRVVAEEAEVPRRAVQAAVREVAEGMAEALVAVEARASQ